MSEQQPQWTPEHAERLARVVAAADRLADAVGWILEALGSREEVARLAEYRTARQDLRRAACRDVWPNRPAGQIDPLFKRKHGEP